MMPSLYFRFLLHSLWSRQPAAAAVLLSGAVCLALALLIWAPLVSEDLEARSELKSLQARKPNLSPPAAVTRGEPLLPAFSGASAVDQFTSIARDVGLPVEEVNYALESPAGHPYRRYRISMSVKSGYPEIRKLMAVLASEMPNASLDAIRCSRENALTQGLGCELAFSVFYRQAAHG